MKRSAKIYLQKVVDAVETLQTQLTIARNEIHQLKGIVEGKKKERCGKRMIIKDKFLLTTQEILDRVLAAEAEKTARKNKRRKKRIRLKLILKEKNAGRDGCDVNSS